MAICRSSNFRMICDTFTWSVQVGRLLVAVAQGTGTAGGVQRVALEFPATGEMTRWMISALDRH
jgi:hypothetical protein